MNLVESFQHLLKKPSAFKLIGMLKPSFHSMKRRFLAGHKPKESTMREYVDKSNLFDYFPERWEPKQKP